MSPPVVSRKRKADVLEADDTPNVTRKSAPDDVSPAYLPAPCLAAVLNFMRYADVRQCMLAGKMMAVEAAGHVEALNITKASELDAPSARRFRSASEVNVLCLISETDAEDDREDRQYPPDQISMETVTRVVPFLSSIPNLERVYFGGVFLDGSTPEVWERYLYQAENFIEPRDHQTIFKTLIQNLVGGFQSRTLPQTLELDGILDGGQLECAGNGREDPDQPCQVCRRVLSSFPLHSLVKPIFHLGCFCVSRVDRIRAVLRRDGEAATLRSSNVGAEMLLGCFKHEMSPMMLSLMVSSEREVDQAFIKKMRDQGASCGRICLSLFGKMSSSKSFKDLLDLVKSTSLLQDVIKDIPRGKLLETFILHSTKDVGKTIFSRHIFESLLEVGLQLNAADYIIVDPENEPALARRQQAPSVHM